MNFRDKHLAHSLTVTRLEQRGPVQPMKIGDETELLNASIPIIERLHCWVNGKSFSISSSQDIDQANAEALWAGASSASYVRGRVQSMMPVCRMTASPLVFGTIGSKLMRLPTIISSSRFHCRERNSSQGDRQLAASARGQYPSRCLREACAPHATAEQPQLFHLTISFGPADQVGPNHFDEFVRRCNHRHANRSAPAGVNRT
jgi:hypothetical protein